MIANMNKHLPSSRRTLLEYLDSDDLTYQTKDGHTYTIEKEEIEMLSRICTEIEKMRLKLPIFVSTDTSSDNAWKVDGMTETSVMSKILERKPFREDMMRFYHPDLKKLRSMLPNAVTVLYLP
jgi:Uncharacterized protein conserved in archaea